MRLPSLLPFLFLTLLQRPTFASIKPYVVYLGGHSHGLRPSSFDANLVQDSHYEFLGSFLGSREFAQDAIFYSYTRHINGFAATLEDEVAAEIAKHPEVVSVFLNQGRKQHTTHSWSFLGLEKDGVVPSGSIWKKARFGEDTIIGNLDTGAWPESESFSDEGLGPIPSKWKGICQNGSDPGFHCNRSSFCYRLSFFFPTVSVKMCSYINVKLYWLRGHMFNVKRFLPLVMQASSHAFDYHWRAFMKKDVLSKATASRMILENGQLRSENWWGYSEKADGLCGIYSKLQLILKK